MCEEVWEASNQIHADTSLADPASSLSSQLLIQDTRETRWHRQLLKVYPELFLGGPPILGLGNMPASIFHLCFDTLRLHIVHISYLSRARAHPRFLRHFSLSKCPRGHDCARDPPGGGRQCFRNFQHVILRASRCFWRAQGDIKICDECNSKRTKGESGGGRLGATQPE